MNAKLHERVERVKHSNAYAKQFLTDGSFTIYLQVNKHCLGHFHTAEQAAEAYNNFARKHYCDEPDEGRGKEISLARAVKKL